MLARVLLMLAVSSSVLEAQDSAGEILSRFENVWEGIDDYTVDLDVNVNMERLKVPDMRVVMYYKKPDRVHFSSEGFALLPRESISLNPAWIREHYDAADVRKVDSAGSTFYRLALEPKRGKSRGRQMALLVQAGRWVPEQLSVGLPDGRSLTATFTNSQIENRWFPSELVVTMEAAPREEGADDGSPQRRTVLPRTGSVKIRYSGYRINTGLEDSIFEKKEIEE